MGARSIHTENYVKVCVLAASSQRDIIFLEKEFKPILPQQLCKSYSLQSWIIRSNWHSCSAKEAEILGVSN